MGLITVDESKCRRCGTCARACPVGIIVLGEGFPITGFPTTVEKIEKGCITCGHCVAACPRGAISHCRMSPDECIPLDEGWRLSPGQLEQLIKGRRSIRCFKPEPVERDVLEKLIEISRYAPTGMNTQSVYWKVYLDDKKVQRLSRAVVDWMGTLDGDEIHGIRGMLKAWEAGRDPVLRNAPHLIIAYGADDDRMVQPSSMIALTTLELAALSFGLGTCWAGFLFFAAKSSAEVAAALELPSGHHMCGGLMIGYPEFEYSRIPARNPARVTWE